MSRWVEETFQIEVLNPQMNPFVLKPLGW